MFASKCTEKCALQTVIAFDSKGCGGFSICSHTCMEPKITQLSCWDSFMPHSVQAELAAVSVEISVSATCCIFYWCFSFFFPVFSPNTF